MEKKQKNEKEQNQLNSYARYSGIAFQMLFTIAIATWAGIKLDEHFKVKNHWFTIFLLLFGVIASIYTVVRSLLNNNK